MELASHEMRERGLYSDLERVLTSAQFIHEWEFSRVSREPLGERAATQEDLRPGWRPSSDAEPAPGRHCRALIDAVRLSGTVLVVGFGVVLIGQSRREVRDR